MDGLIIFVIIIFLIIIAAKFFSEKFTLGLAFKNVYYKKQYLLTKREQEFFQILQRIVQDKYLVFPQIHLDSLLEVKKSEKNQRTFWNKINRKSVDFVICDKQYLKPLLAIELDDNSHYRWQRQDRDQFVNKTLESVGLKYLRIRAAYSYNFEELKSQILQGLL